MTITNGYTTLAEMKALKRITTTDASDDTVIESLIEAVSRYIDIATRRIYYLITPAVARYFTASDEDRVYIGDYVTITSLKLDLDGDGVYETTLTTSDYWPMPINDTQKTYIQLKRFASYVFPTTPLGVELTSTFGFTTAPDDIALACQMIVTNLYSNRFGVSNEGAATITGAGVVITPRDVPPMAADILAKYTRHL